ncbi:MAG: ferritin family protein [Thermoplasmata archaeon]|jgi:rubrerythrin|nr:rubrerythrin [Thermoplasmata archaeon]MVT13496.1 rubrerythrin [Euryarchaeota archaeon]MVT14567.1 rubrerythrin [Euryarchaeota archaeon]MVT35393.1 rubrerythrin [Euryarchaeota archaeon]
MGFSKSPVEMNRVKKFNKDEILMAIREDIAAEIDAINLYLSQATLIDDEFVKSVLIDIANEEKVHLGEFLSVLEKLDPEQVKAIKKGKEETKEFE